MGFLQSLIYAFTYVIPIAGGALADRYGYRRMLLFAFSILSAGYSHRGQRHHARGGVRRAPADGHRRGPVQAHHLRGPSPAPPPRRTRASASASTTG
ncbi:MAG: hypothetical protein IPO28_07465 [Holophagaceae bacterium]|nr:hypothetical protein [Holophagaceae bacterium]